EGAGAGGGAGGGGDRGGGGGGGRGGGRARGAAKEPRQHLQPPLRPPVLERRPRRMIRSMTGYGSAAVDSEVLRASVAIRAVNHRYFALSLHVSRRLAPLEPELNQLVQSPA